jgi:hypothetical protein
MTLSLSGSADPAGRFSAMRMSRDLAGTSHAWDITREMAIPFTIFRQTSDTSAITPIPGVQPANPSLAGL